MGEPSWEWRRSRHSGLGLRDSTRDAPSVNAQTLKHACSFR